MDRTPTSGLPAPDFEARSLADTFRLELAVPTSHLGSEVFLLSIRERPVTFRASDAYLRNVKTPNLTVDFTPDINDGFGHTGLLVTINHQLGPCDLLLKIWFGAVGAVPGDILRINRESAEQVSPYKSVLVYRYVGTDDKLIANYVGISTMDFPIPLFW